MPANGYIRIQDTKVIKDKILVYSLSFSENLKRIILSEKFYVKYDRPVSNVEKSILNIPGVECLATIAWATGSELYVDSLDKNYVYSILSKFRKFNNIQFNNVFTPGKMRARWYICYLPEVKVALLANRSITILVQHSPPTCAIVIFARIHL